MAQGWRKRLEEAHWPYAIVGWLLATYIKACWRTGRWTIDGDDVLDEALKDGPVVAICWHKYSVLAPPIWRDRKPLAMPRDPSPAGRISEAIQSHFKTTPIPISMNGGNLGPVRQIMKKIREGYSLGLTGDGPIGPNRELGPAPLEWMRAAGRPVIVFAWSSAKCRELDTWDKLFVPRLFAGGHVTIRLWKDQIPKKLTEAENEALRAELTAELTDVAQAADRGAGRF